MNLTKMMSVFGGPALVGLLCCAAPAHAETDTPTTVTETKTKKKVKANGDVETKTKTKTVKTGGEEAEGKPAMGKSETAKSETTKTEVKTGVSGDEMGEGAKKKRHVKRTTESDTETGVAKTHDTTNHDTMNHDTMDKTAKTTKTVKTTTTDTTATTGTTAKPLAADNTGKNDPDRSRVGEKPTADQAKNDKSDVQIMAQIRRDVMAEKGLSSSAHNVKIVAESGMVTLKGPVKSAEEKALVEKKAVGVVGVKNVRNEIEIAP